MAHENLARTKQERIQELDSLLYELSDWIVRDEKEFRESDLSATEITSAEDFLVDELMEARGYNDELRVLLATKENHPAYTTYSIYVQGMLRNIGETLGEL